MGQAHDLHRVRRGRGSRVTPEEQDKDPTAAAVGKKGSKARANREPDKESAGHMHARHEAGWHVDGGAISQCHHRADTTDLH
jgi:hypothetical protein